jgi:hypothetical protein
MKGVPEFALSFKSPRAVRQALNMVDRLKNNDMWKFCPESAVRMHISPAHVQYSYN